MDILPFLFCRTFRKQTKVLDTGEKLLKLRQNFENYNKCLEYYSEVTSVDSELCLQSSRLDQRSLAQRDDVRKLLASLRPGSNVELHTCRTKFSELSTCEVRRLTKLSSTVCIGINFRLNLSGIRTA